MEPKQIAGAPLTITKRGKTVETTVQGVLDDLMDSTIAQGDAIRAIRDTVKQILDQLGKEQSQPPAP